MKGWIALDIDGTITEDKYSVPEQVIEFLQTAHQTGWKILLSTGRAASFAYKALEKIPFPFFLSGQNGSICLEMPDQKIAFKKYIDGSLIQEVEKMGSEFIVYSGFEKGDFFYFRPSSFSQESLNYVRAVQEREKSKGQEVENFSKLESTPLIKCFGAYDRVKELGSKLFGTGFFELSMIRDPFYSPYYMLLVTDRFASKGASLKKLISIHGKGQLVIAAGNDENDLPLLREADVKIAMPEGSELLRRAADFIAPPVSENGIIDALKIAMKNV